MLTKPAINYNIIPATAVNFHNVDEICGYQLLLCKIYECEGGFNLPAKSTPVTREIARQALIWLREVKKLMESILTQKIESADIIPNYSLLIPNLGVVPRLLAGYDMMHRIAHGFPCFDYLREIKCRTADRWLRGDKSISKTDVVLLLLTETDRDIRTLEERFIKYSIRVMSSWVEDLIKDGSFTDTSLSETYRRLSYLLDANLFAYLGSKEEAKAKARWVKTHLLPETRIDGLDTATLWDYAQFIDSIPFGTPAQYERNGEMYKHILSKIALRPDTHPYAVRAIELTLARHKALSA